ncbi:hypothetical protein BDM02DRAFT_3132996 [Thelephora ganbajun]|uniref:Uncharacterized protein n=1 Tax=Thelephora ganbajun TaxID=370292 RepID=A0ACB6Z0B7_THEGA|nr:hypothetical protein BDM02DRAFT_3132996 [Thelephora ganbajun]
MSRYNPEISFAPFHGFSSSLKSLRVRASALPRSRVWEPRLVPFPSRGSCTDRSVNYEWDSPPSVYPSDLPTVPGTLELDLFAMEGITHRLLDLPNGLHFRRSQLDEELMVTCSDALERLDTMHNLFGYTGPASIDLSKATKPRDAIFRARSLSVA